MPRVWAREPSAGYGCGPILKKCYGLNYHICMIDPKNINCPERISCKKKNRELHKSYEKPIAGYGCDPS